MIARIRERAWFRARQQAAWRRPGAPAPGPGARVDTGAAIT